MGQGSVWDMRKDGTRRDTVADTDAQGPPKRAGGYNPEETINAENLLQHPNAKEWLIAAAKSDYQLLAKLASEHPTLVKLQMGQTSRSRSGGTCDVVFELPRMASGFADQLAGSEHRLRRETIGQVTRKSHPDRSVRQCLDHYEHSRNWSGQTFVDNLLKTGRDETKRSRHDSDLKSPRIV
uniref:Uncharacterized protein n=1 Tax=Anopheles atroparvus TaxID=41427 RepID=A0A182J4L0_ANOAO